MAGNQQSFVDPRDARHLESDGRCVRVDVAMTGEDMLAKWVCLLCDGMEWGDWVPATRPVRNELVTPRFTRTACRAVRAGQMDMAQCALKSYLMYPLRSEQF